MVILSLSPMVQERIATYGMLGGQSHCFLYFVVSRQIHVHVLRRPTIKLLISFGVAAWNMATPKVTRELRGSNVPCGVNALSTLLTAIATLMPYASSMSGTRRVLRGGPRGLL